MQNLKPAAHREQTLPDYVVRAVGVRCATFRIFHSTDDWNQRLPRRPPMRVEELTMLTNPNGVERPSHGPFLAHSKLLD